MIIFLHRPKEESIYKDYTLDESICNSVILEQGDTPRLEIEVSEAVYHSSCLNVMEYGDFFLTDESSFILTEISEEFKDGKFIYKFRCESIFRFRLKTLKTHAIGFTLNAEDLNKKFLQDVLEALSFDLAINPLDDFGIFYSPELAYRYDGYKDFNIKPLEKVGEDLNAWFDNFLETNGLFANISSSFDKNDGIFKITNYIDFDNVNIDWQKEEPITTDMCDEIVYKFKDKQFYPFIYHASQPYDYKYYECYFSPSEMYSSSFPTTIATNDTVVYEFNSSSWNWERDSIYMAQSWIEFSFKVVLHDVTNPNGTRFVYYAPAYDLQPNKDYYIDIPVFSEQSFNALYYGSGDKRVGYQFDRLSEGKLIKKGNRRYIRFVHNMSIVFSKDSPLFYIASPIEPALEHKNTFAFAECFGPAWGEFVSFTKIKKSNPVLELKLKDKAKGNIKLYHNYFYNDTKLLCNSTIDSWEKGVHTRDVNFKLVL